MWNRLDLHLENLIPGLGLAGMYLLLWPPTLGPLHQPNAVISIALIGVVYLVGVVANLAGRFLFDGPAGRFVSPHFMRWLARDELSDGNPIPKVQDRDKKFKEIVKRALNCGEDAIVNEVLKRRQTGRLARVCFFPAVLWVIKLVQQSGWAWLLLSVPVYLATLAVFSYAEVAILHEAYHAKANSEEDSD